jgi:hypothetical protein
VPLAGHAARLARTTFGTWLVLATAAPSALVPLSADAADAPAYDIALRLEPAQGTIDARVEITHPGSSAFRLARDLTIRRLVADGMPSRFEEGPADGDGAREVTLPGSPPGHLLVEYGGQMRPSSFPRLTSQVNLVNAGLVELAGYVSWYPKCHGSPAFTFHLVVDTPDAFAAVSNGRLIGKQPGQAGRGVSEWASYTPVSDIVLVSAPGLRLTVSPRAGSGTEIYSTALSRTYVEAMATDVDATIGFMQRTLASAAGTDRVRIVYSPRPGWGYVRQPMIVVSEESARLAASQPYGRARDVRYVAHEIAHYWWYRADTATPDDWINEGLAEYSALLACRTVVGAAFADVLIAEYDERSATSPTTTAILDTQSSSPDRELNRYVRPVLMLENLRRRYGDERMTTFLRSASARFARDGRATTHAFLDEVAAQFGDEGREEVRRGLTRTEWRPAEGPHPYVLSADEGEWLGTWTGTLTQGSVTNAVVLRLQREGDHLVAMLDSPQPGAPAIPLSAVRIDAGVLRFALGTFGITFRGTLGGSAAVIDGQWTQGGTSYPLALARRERANP